MAIGRISGQMLKANLLRSGTDLAFETNLLVLDVTNSLVGIGTATPARKLHISDTGALRLPSGTDAQRGTSANGDIRYNTDQAQIEGYVDGAWTDLGSGSKITDADGNTGIDVERSADENQIHFFIENVGDVAHIRSDGAIELNNLEIDNQTITGLTTNTNITISPNGTGSVAMAKVDIAGGEIDGTTIGANSAAAATFTNLTANGTINIDGDGSGDNIDGVIIGANLAAAGTFTTVDTSGNVTVGGNLIVNGVTTTIESTTLQIEDPLIVLAKNNSGGTANTYDQGLLIKRGSDTNQFIGWDESEDEFAVFSTSETGDTAGNINLTAYADFSAKDVYANSFVSTGITIEDNNITATQTNDDLVLTGSGTGSVRIDLVDINGGAIDGTIIGANTKAAGNFTTVDTNDHIVIGADNKAIKIGAGGDLQISHDGTDTTISNATGILKINGAASSSIKINAAAANVDTQISGDTDAELIYVDASADKIGISTATPAYILDIDSTNAVRLPSGDDTSRPSAATGVIRFNTSNSAYEGSTDGSTWTTFAMGGGGVASISKVSATGDGSTTTFSGFFADSPATAANVLVFIDNVHQEPTENYTVSSNNITFTSAPHSGARIYALVGFDAGSMTTGGVARTQTDSVAFTSSATNIMTFNATSIRSAELFVTVTDAGNTEYSCLKANVIHDGSDAYISVYGIVNTGAADSVTLTATLNGSTVEVKAISTGGASTAMVQYSLQAV
jgi:hypothetical protein